MNIKINSLTDVTIDDVPRGGVVDVLFHAASAGDETLRAPMLDALTAWHESLMTEAQGKADAKLDAAMADKDAANDATLARIQGEHAAALQAAQTAADAKLAEAAQAVAAATADGEQKLAAQKSVDDSQLIEKLDYQAKSFGLVREAYRGALGFGVRSDVILPPVEDNVLAQSIADQRNVLTKQLELKDADQAQLAAAGRDSEAKLRATLAEAVTHLDAIKAVADRANQTADQRAADEKAARLAEAQAVVAQLTA